MSKSALPPHTVSNTAAPSGSRYPDYNVLDKRDTPSWDDATRQVIDARLAVPATPQFFEIVEWAALQALCACVIPQRADAPYVAIAALVDDKLSQNRGDGYRDARMPALREAWRRGLAALDSESRATFEAAFADLSDTQRVGLLQRMQDGKLQHASWQGMPSAVFFAERVLHDICSAYYSHPYAWNLLGFGGPANPRGYVRMYFDRRDPWDASEATPGREAQAAKENQRAR
ncbi:MAG: gluconate 2-dehydrogenase subunit 3 family protein [Janthinobacterium lividum]